MTIKLTTLSTVMISLALTACATGPTHQNYKESDAACVQGDYANFIKFFTEGEAHVNIEEMDGVQTDTRIVCVSPGEHRLGFTAVNDGRIGQDFIKANFEANKKYKVRANRNGLGFNCVLYDITDGNETPVTKFRTAITSHAPVYIPMYMPAPK